MKKSGKVSFGLIGCGDISWQEAQAIKNAKNTELVMVMDVKEEYARKLGDEFNVAYTSNLERLLSRNDVDAVVIAAPHNLHASLAKQAAEANKHIVMEKPVAATLEEADAVIGICRERNVKLSIAYIMRYFPQHQEAKKLINAGIIGRVVNITCVTHYDKPKSYWTGGYSKRAKTDWRASLRESGGGVFLMNASHNIDYLSYIIGEQVETLYAECDNFSTPYVEVEDTISASVRFTGGAIGSFAVSSAALGERIFWEKIYGKEGTIDLANPLRVYVTKPNRQFEPHQWREIEFDKKVEPYLAARTVFMEKFAAAVLDDGEVPITGEAGKEILAVVKAAYLSSTEKRPVILKPG
jgi:predicted dehydrogenase